MLTLYKASQNTLQCLPKMTKHIPKHHTLLLPLPLPRFNYLSWHNIANTAYATGLPLNHQPLPMKYDPANILKLLE